MITPEKEQEIREEFGKYCNTDNFSVPPYEHNVISDWWLSNLSKALEEHDKERDAELVEKISEYIVDLCENSVEFKNYVLDLITKK